MENKAVVLGASYHIGLSIIRCLGIHGIKVAAIDYSWEEAFAFHSRYCSEIVIGPHCKTDSYGLLDLLVDIAKKEESSPVLYPSDDRYVEFIDQHLHELQKYYLFPQTKQG